MPELPEVETIRNLLRLGGESVPSLVGMTITQVQLLWTRSLAAPSPEEFLERLPGQKIVDIGRRGEFLIFQLEGQSLLVHLRMSGDLVVAPFDAPPALHDRLILGLRLAIPDASDFKLAFNDARKFGRVWLTANPQEVVGGLGPEPLDPAFNAQELYRRLQTTSRQLKPLLLDQSFLAGLGNIYADEALNLARLHPLVHANALTPEQAERLWLSIRETLLEGIRRNGASIDWVYRGGDFQNYFRVYQRTGKPCPVCGTMVERIVVGQRGTHYCPNCQRL